MLNCIMRKSGQARGLSYGLLRDLLVQVSALADRTQEQQSDQDAQRAAGHAQERNVVQAEPVRQRTAFGAEKQERRDLVAEQERRSDEQRAGQHAEHQSIDARTQAAVVEVD